MIGLSATTMCLAIEKSTLWPDWNRHFGDGCRPAFIVAPALASPHSLALTSKFHQAIVVHDAIDGRGGQLLVPEDRPPLLLNSMFVVSIGLRLS